ncbi:MgtC/SapB family protein [Metabacillus iocasae]|uniref:Mg2+ transporter-C (MgtC) family protein n=1 Tax=Priestia iocasae TaxID=2291674 RepID=A0ABS2QYU7_9BACI|nr:MgtC/SapB family protein [Metabacillus iocasae]MBM7704668.1 putative Mg2+ transporter-C (MgtC) family protein [Metabacillus iocasae]
MGELLQVIVYNDVLLKLSLAAVGGVIIGLERELKGKPLGLKTCLIVSVIACLLTIVSYESAFLYSKEYSRPMDPGRIPSYVISGIGFLGAGVILRRSNEAISGLTTAALVLASAAIGITIGAGFYIEALLGVLFIIFGIKVLPLLFEWIGPKKLKEREIRGRLWIEKTTDLTQLLIEIKNKELGVKGVKVKEEKNDILINCIIITRKGVYTTDVYYQLKSLTGVLKVEVESLD